MSQFSPEENKKTLADFLKNIDKDIYPVGRLDYDSEGLLLLTNDKKLTHQLLHPNFQHERTYWAQVEGTITETALEQLRKGVVINVNGKSYTTKQCKAAILLPFDYPERNPPIRFRKEIPTSWICITLTEGKNRQVRKMTAAVGFPTLRLIRSAIGNYQLKDIPEGNYITLSTINSDLLFVKSGKK